LDLGIKQCPNQVKLHSWDLSIILNLSKKFGDFLSLQIIPKILRD
jgi:hypothetical protein